MTDLLELAARAESATGPDRELDVAIHIALDVPNGNRAENVSKLGPFGPAYTASIDAAMSLVPEGAWLELKGPRRYLHIPTSSPNFWSAYLASFNHEGDRMRWGATPALAIVASALRARAAA